MYKVIKDFTDSFDNGHKYSVGDEFPRKGVAVGEGRIAKLASDKNRQKTPLIAKSKDLDLATTPAQSSPSKTEQGAVPPIKKEGKSKVNNERKKKSE